MLTERSGGLRRFLPFARERFTPDDRVAQAVRERRRIAEQGWKPRYTIAQELVVPVRFQDETGKVPVVVYTHQDRDGGWGSLAVLNDPRRHSHENPPIIMGRVTLDALSLPDAVTLTDEWVANSTGLPMGEVNKSMEREHPLLEGRYQEFVHHISPNTP